MSASGCLPLDRAYTTNPRGYPVHLFDNPDFRAQIMSQGSRTNDDLLRIIRHSYYSGDVDELDVTCNALTLRLAVNAVRVPRGRQ